MKRLEKDQIRKEFNAQRQAQHRNYRTSGVDDVLRELGHVIADLRAEGINVSLTMLGTTSEQAVAMFPGNRTGLSVQATGILKIGNTELLLAIAFGVDGKGDGPTIALSKGDMRNHGTAGQVITPKLQNLNSEVQNVVPAHLYTPSMSPDALIKLEKEIIRIAAADKVVNDGLYDLNNPALKKDLEASKQMTVKREPPPPKPNGQ